MGRASVPGLVRGKGQGRAKGFRRGECGAAEPLPVRTVAKQEGGAEGRPRAAGPPFPRGTASSGFPPQWALQVLRDQVGLVMFGEVVTPHEAFLALGTLKAFVPWEEEMASLTELIHRHCPSPPRGEARVTSSL